MERRRKLREVFVPYRGLFNFNYKKDGEVIVSGVFVPYRGLFNFNRAGNRQEDDRGA